MSNELIRRLEMLDKCLDQKEKNSVVDKYVQQLVNSEYSWKLCREIVVSGLVGYVRKMKNKKLHNIPVYRSNKFSLRTRVNKKLTEKYNWFRTKKVEIENKSDPVNIDIEKPSNRWKHYLRKKAPIDFLEKVETKEAPPQAVLFVQFTPNSELSSRIREVINKLKPWTGISLKVVERVGEKLEDMIHKSNPWDNTDCERKDCFSCKSSAKMSEPIFNYCKTRSVVYQTWCQTCLESKNPNISSDKCEHTSELSESIVQQCESSHVSTLQKIDGADQKVEIVQKGENVISKEVDSQKVGDNLPSISNVNLVPKSLEKGENCKKRAREKVEKGPFYCYIGETSRSAYERGLEHLKDLEFRRTKSHFLRHVVECHPGMLPENLDFRMKILSTHKSAFERQIREAVMIDLHNGPRLMNSKLEYTRCALPKMSIKMGDKAQKEDPMVTKEKSTVEKIKLIYKLENKREAKMDNQVPKKRAKLETEISTDKPQNSPILAKNVDSVENKSLKPNQVTQLMGIFEGNIEKESRNTCKVSSPLKQKKVQRSKVSLKVSPIKKSPVFKKVNTEKRSPSPDFVSKTGSPNPNQDTDIGAPIPNLDVENGSPVPKMGNFQVSQNGENDQKVLVGSSLKPNMVDSPSLRPVNIRTLIDNFENNVSKLGQKKEKVIDAFEALMMSGGKGDTLRKTPKRKPKRLISADGTRKVSSVMEKWLSNSKK